MPVTLAKGSTVSLSKEAGPVPLSSLTVGLGWDTAQTPGGHEFDLDASALVLDATGRVLADEYFVFYGNPRSLDGAVAVGPDNRTGQGDGDDEQIVIELTALNPAAQTVVIVVSIDKADERGQTFGQVSNAYVRVVNNTTTAELARFDLASGASSDTAFVFAELYREGAEWKFRAVGDAHPSGFVGTLRNYGVNV
ncbi:TerD family protein [Pseudoclavibacter helvolus]|uniref:TerD family protein n=1 Tax=Pseudoclavibacter helvolus TaxID=255205 RepID=UPI0024AE83B0|nr:TerD family protein [Pseudoclavibacter helvolus]